MSLWQEIRGLSPSRKELRSFGLLVGAVFAVIGAWVTYRDHAVGPWLLGIGGALVLAGAIAPGILQRVYRVWMALALSLGFVMTRVILSLFYYLILTPVGAGMRLFGKDLLDQKIDRSKASYWQAKEYPITGRSRFTKYF